MRYQVYEPDTLDFDFSGIIGTIGSGIVTAGKSIATNLFTAQNLQTVVSGIVAKQVQAKQPTVSAPSQTAAQAVMPTPGFYPAVSAPQPVIVSGGGGGMPYPISAPAAQGTVFGIHPGFLIAGAAVFALILSKK